MPSSKRLPSLKTWSARSCHQALCISLYILEKVGLATQCPSQVMHCPQTIQTLSQALKSVMLLCAEGLEAAEPVALRPHAPGCPQDSRLWLCAPPAAAPAGRHSVRLPPVHGP